MRSPDIRTVVQRTLYLAYQFGSDHPEFCHWFVDRLQTGFYVNVDTDGVCTEFLILPPEGSLSKELFMRYQRNAREKEARLRANPEHYASQQSRDPALERWTGAIRATNGTVHSFSGQPEAVDEAICLVVALTLGDLATEDEAYAISYVTNNTFFASFWEWVKEVSRNQA